MATKRPLRILYILNASGGGATQGILELLRVLPRDEYEAFLVVPDLPNERQRAVFAALAQACFVVPMTWWNIKSDLPWGWRMLVWGRNWLRTLGHLLPVLRLCQIIRAQQIDIVYTNTVMMLDGALAARLCGVPHIWHIKEWIGARARVKFGLPDALLVRLIGYLSARVLVMSHFIGEIFVKHGAAHKVQVLHDGVNLADFDGSHAGAALRAELGIVSGQFVVGMSASLSATWKRHDLFINMAALLARRFPQMVFVVFGVQPQRYRNPAYNRPWAYAQSLRAMVTQLGLETSFRWAGFCDDIPQMMDALDVLVHPCDIEPFGRVAIEAMAAARPVVGPQRGGIAEIVSDQVTGLLVEPDNPSAFADAVALLHDDVDRRALLGVHARQRAADFFSIEKYISEICQALNQTQSLSEAARSTRRSRRAK